MRNKIGGIVLCGGRSSRMGRPKAWLPFGPEVLLQRVVRLLGKVVEPIVVVAAPAQQLPDLPSEVLVVRDQQEHLGPLAGLAEGLAALRNKADAAYLSACDVPFLQPEFVSRIIFHLALAPVVMPQVEGRLHPLAAGYGLEALPAAQHLLREGRLRPVFLCDVLPTRIISETEVAEVDPHFLSLRNLNTPEDYDQALRDAQHLAPSPSSWS